MNIEFIKKYNLFEPGAILRDVFKSDGEVLISKGVAKEHFDPIPEPFKKFDWGAQLQKVAAERIEQEETAKTEKAKIKTQKGDVSNDTTPKLEK